MSQVVFKYPLRVTDEQTIEMPQMSKVLCVQCQYGVPCLWALVSPDMPGLPHKMKVHMVGTGHSADHVRFGDYVGTFQLRGGELVFHVFAEHA